MYHFSDSVHEASMNFSRAIECALTDFHKSQGKVACYPNESKVIKQDRPCNPWYDDRCKAARKTCLEAAWFWGAGSREVKLAVKEYRRITQAIKREWEGVRAAELLSDLRCQPNNFWSAYGSNRKISPLTDVRDWTEYFKKLFELPEHVPRQEVGEESIRASLFLLPSKVHLAQAENLNLVFTEDEIVKALDKTVNGKSAGVDGVPMEFLKHAVIVTPGGAFSREKRQFVLANQITFLFN